MGGPAGEAANLGGDPESPVENEDMSGMYEATPIETGIVQAEEAAHLVGENTVASNVVDHFDDEDTSSRFSGEWANGPIQDDSISAEYVVFAAAPVVEPASIEHVSHSGDALDQPFEDVQNESSDEVEAERGTDDGLSVHDAAVLNGANRKVDERNEDSDSDSIIMGPVTKVTHKIDLTNLPSDESDEYSKDGENLEDDDLVSRDDRAKESTVSAGSTSQATPVTRKTISFQDAVSTANPTKTTAIQNLALPVQSN